MTPILSIFDVMLQRKATKSISLVPFSLTILINGSPKPSCRLLKLRIYEPITVVKIPRIPSGLGNSPSIRGDVIRRKTGVIVAMGKVSERGLDLRAL